MRGRDRRSDPARSRGAPARFVIAGGHDTGFEEVRAAARRLKVEYAVSFPGVIGRGEKTDLMRRCRLYLQPTRYERFGVSLPIVLLLLDFWPLGRWRREEKPRGAFGVTRGSKTICS